MIEFIYDSQKYENTFIRCMNDYDEYYWATSWCGDNFHAYQTLLNNKSKIKLLATGAYDNDGHPIISKEFIANFWEKGGAVHILGKIKWETGNKYGKGTNPIHTKVYIFYSDEKNFEGFIGSANFTKNGFENYYEAMIHFNQDSVNNQQLRSLFEKVLSCNELSEDVITKRIMRYGNRNNK